MTSRSHHLIKSYSYFSEWMDFTYWWSVINEAKSTQMFSLKQRIASQMSFGQTMSLHYSAMQWYEMHCAVMHCPAIWGQVCSQNIACRVHGTAHLGRSALTVDSPLSRWIIRCTSKVKAVSCRLKWPYSEALYSQGHSCLKWDHLGSSAASGHQTWGLLIPI